MLIKTILGRWCEMRMQIYNPSLLLSVRSKEPTWSYRVKISSQLVKFCWKRRVNRDSGKRNGICSCSKTGPISRASDENMFIVASSMEGKAQAAFAFRDVQPLYFVLTQSHLAWKIVFNRLDSYNVAILERMRPELPSFSRYSYIYF